MNGQQNYGIHTMEFFSAIKKNKITSFIRRRKDLENNMLSEISQTQKEKRNMFSLICLRQGICEIPEKLQIMKMIIIGAREKG